MPYTDADVQKMEKQLNKIYKQAQKETQATWDEYMKKAQVKTDKLQVAYAQALASGDPAAASAAKDAYNKAMLNQTLHNAHYQATVDQLTDKLSDVNQQALNYLNGEMPKVYCKSYNAFSEEHIKGYSFELVDESTIEYLVKNGNKTLLPQKQLNVPKDKLWNTKTINSQVLQGILQGESIPKISARLFPEINAKSDGGILKKNKEAAVRNARTMVTGAENKGRMDSYIKAQNDGVILKKVWVSHHSERTRDWHADLSGVEKDINEPFENDYGEIMYPGDPTAHPANVYNCRCSIKTKIIGFKPLGKPALYIPAKTPGKYAAIYNGVSVTAQYYSMLNEDKAVGNEFWKALNAEGKPSAVWKEYLAGDTSQAVTDKLDDILAKYKGTGKPIKPGKAKPVAPVVQKPKPDLGMYQDKSMTATYYSVKAEDKALGKEFWDVIQSSPTPSMTWNQYLVGVAPQDITEKLDAILLQHKGTGAWSKPVGAKAAAKKAAKTAAKTTNTTAATAAPDPDDLAKAKAKAAAAQGNLQSLGNKTYSGIWMQDVSLSDYESKAYAIPAKKSYYMSEIDKLANDPNYATQYSAAEKAQQITKYQKYLSDLDEFEAQGQLYVQYSKAYREAAEEVRKLTPVSERFGPDAYTQTRKDAAVWAKSAQVADDTLRSTSGEVWINASKLEKESIYEYTRSYHKFNEPLRGIEYGSNAYKGVGKTNLDAKGNGKMLNAMTDILEKAELPQDQWFQRGCQYGGMDKFFNCSSDLLRYGTQAELENELLGKTVTEYGFMSMGSAKGQGFSGGILMNIYAPAGTKAMYVEPISAFGRGDKLSWNGKSKQSYFGGELETILQQNTDFRITKIERKNGGTIYIDLEIIAQNEPQRWVP